MKSKICCIYAVLYMFKANICVDRYGPPFVKAKFWSNNLNAFDSVKKRPIVNASATKGTIMFSIFCKKFAPSKSAASNSEVGIF